MFYKKGKLIIEHVRYAIKEIIFGYRVCSSKIWQLIELVDDLPGIKFFTARVINNKIKLEKLILEKIAAPQVD